MSGVAFVAVISGALLVSIQLSRSPGRTAMSDSAFVNLATRAAKREFVATYVITGTASPLLQNGTVILASDSQLATSHTLNNEDYSGFGQYYAYVFHEQNGELVQWIQKGPNVSWCLKLRHVDSDHLQCTGPTAYVPSNGYAYQGLAFIPRTVLQPVKNFFYGQPERTPPVLTEQSKTFGPLHCLLQTSGIPHLRTCINNEGFIVSSTYRRGQYRWSVLLTSLNSSITASDFTTLLAPSGNVPLPPP
jgi:hypothetical protein